MVGTPGTGKRPVAQALGQQHGFVHLDFEREEVRERFLASKAALLREEIAALAAAGRGLVITWAAGPPGQLREIRRLRLLGLEPIWFDSDRGSAGPAHFAAGPWRAARFHFVDSFERDGTFRPVEAVAAELLEVRPRLRPRPLRDRVAAALQAVPRPTVVPARRLGAGLRWRVAGGLALAAGVVGAAAGLVVNPQGGSVQRGPVAIAAHTAHARVAALPRKGVLVSGRSLAGVKLGDTKAQVRALWGPGQHLARCEGCRPAIWYYSYPTGDPVGAGVQFSNGRVVAVFTLGSPAGWHTETGIKVGQVLDNPLGDSSDRSVWKTCAGFSAKSTRTTPDAVTSILTQGAAVYGFALTRPSVSPCQ